MVGPTGSRPPVPIKGVPSTIATVAHTYTVAVAARMLGVSKTTAYTLIEAGQFPVTPIRCGRRILIPGRPLRVLLGIETDSDD
jgi:excisionase family DNA binding protein